MTSLPVSVCMISGAEAHRIGRALESVAGWAAEIIVVLNEDVQDGTEEIAVRHAARVFREPWKGHIAQKNAAASKASQPWILGLDADEVVSPGLQKEIAVVLAARKDAPNFSAYCFPRSTCFCGRWIRHGDWYPDRQTRLWQRGKAHWDGVDPHDRLQVEGPVGRLRSDLLHYTAEDIDQQLAKVSSYSTYFVKQSIADGRHSGLFDLTVRPAWRFFRAYLLRLGFLDGWQGYYIAWTTAFYSLTRYVKVIEARERQPIDKIPPAN